MKNASVGTAVESAELASSYRNGHVLGADLSNPPPTGRFLGTHGTVSGGPPHGDSERESNGRTVSEMAATRPSLALWAGGAKGRVGGAPWRRRTGRAGM